ncbi:uncharacterized protein B0H18DRAFT_67173 [Fomitopsis serialis]|uniref:uncharacterized protein n=1 Tax=Fomitopsis serialis TaxID=139415 RepID=UPI002007BA35|nr:uncharacterized protein B0H18DRAFT_67173 [Neoantrodia serialis]KAH9931792.1 hypothetical protein B0H18DRAFT_67173 [Neoantrodia serialis]
MSSSERGTRHGDASPWLAFGSVDGFVAHAERLIRPIRVQSESCITSQAGITAFPASSTCIDWTACERAGTRTGMGGTCVQPPRSSLHPSTASRPHPPPSRPAPDRRVEVGLCYRFGERAPCIRGHRQYVPYPGPRRATRKPYVCRCGPSPSLPSLHQHHRPHAPKLCMYTYKMTSADSDPSASEHRNRGTAAHRTPQTGARGRIVLPACLPYHARVYRASGIWDHATDTTRRCTVARTTHRRRPVSYRWSPQSLMVTRPSKRTNPHPTRAPNASGPQLCREDRLQHQRTRVSGVLIFLSRWSLAQGAHASVDGRGCPP